MPFCHQEFRSVPKMEVYKAILGVGFPVSISRIHTVYIGEDEPSILGTNEMFGDFVFLKFGELIVD